MHIQHHTTKSSFLHDHPDHYSSPIIKKTILSTMYNICLVCIMETLKILGEKILIQPDLKASSNAQKANAHLRLPAAPPSRTPSKVIRVNQKWVKQILKKKRNDDSSSESSTSSSLIKRSRSMSVATSPSKRCFNGIRQSRRNSYPPVQYQSKLECVIEEDLSQV